MKLEDRERIEGTDITIGRRVYYKDGGAVISPRWAAEYRELTGKQVCVNLNTKSKLEARRKGRHFRPSLKTGSRTSPMPGSGSKKSSMLIFHL